MNSITVIGIIGAMFIVTAYLLNINKVLDSQSKTYLFINMVGAILVLINMIHDIIWASIITNSVWLIAGGYTLIKKWKQ